MPIIGEAEIAITPDTSGFMGSLESGISSAFGKLGKLGLAAGAALAAGIGGAVGAATVQFAGFQDGMNEVFTLLGADAPTQTLDSIEQQVKDLSTGFGIDLNDAIKGTYDAISAGVDPSDFEGFNQFTETAAEFAKAGATDFGTSIDLLTTATNAFGLDAADAGKTADTLFATIQGGKTTADELAASLFQVAPIAATTGVSLEETAAGLATLTAQGVPTAAAATQLKAAFGELGKSGTQADKVFRELAGVGFTEFLNSGGSVQDAFNLMREGADASGVSVGDFFGSVEAGAALLGTTGLQADRFATNLDNISNAAGATGDAADRMNEGLLAAFRRIKQTVLVALVDLGDQLSPFISQIANVIETFLPAAIEGAVSFIQATVERVGPIISGVVEVVTGLLGDIDFGGLFSQLSSAGDGSGLVDVFRQVADAAKDLGPTVATIGEALGTILGANAAIARDVFTDLVPLVLDLAVTVLPPLAELLAVVADAFSLIATNVPLPVLVGAVVAFKAINTALAANKALTAGGGLVKWVTQLGLVSKATAAWSLAQRGVNLAQAHWIIIQSQGGIVAFLKNSALASKATTLWASAQRLLNLSLLANPIFLAVAAVAAIGVALVVAYKHSETFRDAVSGLVDAFGPLIDAVKTIGGAFVDLFTGDFSGFVDGIREGIGQLGPALAGIGSEVGTLLVDGIVAGLNAIGLGGIADWFTGILEPIRGLWVDLAGGVEAFLSAFTGAADSIGATGFAGAMATLGGVLSPIIGIVREIGGVLVDVFQGDFSGALDGLKTIGFDLIPELLAGVVAALPGFAAELLGLVGGVLLDIAAQIPGLVGGIGGVVAGALLAAVTAGLKAVGLGPALEALADGDFSQAFDLIGDKLKELPLFVVGIMADVGHVILDGFEAVLTGVGLGGIAGPLTDAFRLAFDAVIAVVRLSWRVVGALFDFWIEAVGHVIDGIGVVWDTGIIQTIFGAWLAYVGFVWDLISGAVGLGIAAVGLAIAGAKALWDTGVLQGAFGFLADVIGVAWDAITGTIGIGVAVVAGIIAGIAAVWDTGAIQAIFGFLADAIGVAWDLITGAVQFGVAAVEGIVDTIEAAWDTGAMQDVFGVLADVIGAAWDAITQGVELGVEAVEAIIETIDAAWDTGAMQDVFDALGTAIQVAWDLITGAVEMAVDVIAGIISGATAVWDTGIIQGAFDLLAAAVGLAWDAITGAVQLGVDAIKAIIDGIAAVWDTGVIQTAFDLLAEVFGLAWDAATAVVETAVDTVRTVLEWFGIGGGETPGAKVGRSFDGATGPLEVAWAAITGAIQGAVDVVTGIFDGARAAWGAITEVFGEIVTAAVDFLADLLGKSIEGWQLIYDTVAGKVEEIATFLWDTWAGIVQGVVDFLADVLGDMVNGWQIIFDTVAGKVEEIATFLWDTWAGIVIAVVDFLADVLGDMIDGWQIIFDTVAGKVEEIATFLWDTWAGIVIAVVDFLADLLGDMIDGWQLIYDAVSGKVQELFDRVTAVFTDLLARVTGLAGEILTAVTDKFTELKDTATGIFETARDALTRIFGEAKDTLIGIAEAARTGIEGPFQAVRDFLSGLFDGINVGFPDISSALNVLQKLADKANAVIKVFNLLPGVSIPSIPAVNTTTVKAATSFVGSALGNIFGDGGLTSGPSIAGEDGPELILPLTKPAKLREVLTRYGGLVTAAVGDDEFLSTLLGAATGSALPSDGPGGVRTGTTPRPGAAAGFVSGAAPPPAAAQAAQVVNTATTYVFNGAEASAVARQIRDRDRSIVAGLRVRA